MKWVCDNERPRDSLSARAEVHWYEAHGIGKLEMKIKDFI